MNVELEYIVKGQLNFLGGGKKLNRFIRKRYFSARVERSNFIGRVTIEINVKLDHLRALNRFQGKIYSSNIN